MPPCASPPSTADDVERLRYSGSVTDSSPKPTSSASPAAAEGPASQDGPSGDEAAVVEERTQPYRLKPQVEKLAKQRRRTTAAELLVKRPRHPEVRVPLDRTETFIGRDPKCDIVLNDETASRRHARIARNEGGYFEIVDLSSKNGILVDDERISRMTLMDGDGFLIGDTQFVIVVGPLLGADEAARS